MNRRALYIALGLLIVVNVVVLLGVARNRGGEADALLTLTERELPLSWSFRHKENTGVSFHLSVNSDSEVREWFDEGKLAELGFDPGQYSDSDHREIYRVLPRKAYVVLEYDGDAWQRYRHRQLQEIEDLAVKVGQGTLEAEEAENQKEESLFQLTVASRLFSVDVGPDAEALRLRYADRSRYIILPALLRMDFDWRQESEKEEKKRHLYGRVQEILVDKLHVPRKLQVGLETLPEISRIQPGYTWFNRENPARVHYQVQVAVGRRYEPWVKGIDIGDEYNSVIEP
jgi:hypothetical protein